MLLKRHLLNRTILRHHIKGRIKINSKEDFHQVLVHSELRQERLVELVIRSIKDTDTTPLPIKQIHSLLIQIETLFLNLGLQLSE